MNEVKVGGPALIYVGYAMLSASAYVAATIVMKFYGRLGFSKAAVLIALFLVAAVFFETVALKTERLGMILLLILGSECLLGLLASWLWFQEKYSNRELVGFGLIIAGVALTKL
jgi:small multidrug resistance pump